MVMVCRIVTLPYLYGPDTHRCATAPQKREDHELTRTTMPSFVDTFAAREGILPPSGGNLKPGLELYFTNFFISRVDWCVRAPFTRYL